MASNVNPTVRRRRLGSELRKLREQKGMTAEEVAARLLVSQSKISRLENGRRSISQRDVRDLCGVYGVEDSRIVDSLMQMAKESRQQGWWHAFGDVPYSVYIGLETDAASLRVYEPQVVPGLLQTREYARGGHRGNAAGSHPGRGRQAGPGAAASARSGSPIRAPLLRLLGGAGRGGAAPGGRRRGDHDRPAGAPGGTQSPCPMSPCRCCPFDDGRPPGDVRPVRDPGVRRRLGRDAWCIWRASPATSTWRSRTTSTTYSVMYEHLRAQALGPDQSRQFIHELTQDYSG